MQSVEKRVQPLSHTVHLNLIPTRTKVGVSGARKGRDFSTSSTRNGGGELRGLKSEVGSPFAKEKADQGSHSPWLWTIRSNGRAQRSSGPAPRHLENGRRGGEKGLMGVSRICQKSQGGSHNGAFKARPLPYWLFSPYLAGAPSWRLPIFGEGHLFTSM